MELIDVRIEEGTGPGKIRLVGDIGYDDRPGREEQIWFEVPEEYADSLSETGNPWLVLLAPLAATLGEALRLSRPVDPLLVRNVRELLCIWKTWYPHLHVVPLELEAYGPPRIGRGMLTGAFFSGGVDSFFTAVRHRREEDSALPIDEHILIHGFDFPLAEGEAFRCHRLRLERASEELGASLVEVVTNVRETRLREASWADLWHGAALAAVGLALETRYRFLLIASTSNYAELAPYGSHPMTDAMYSTESTRVVHDGACATRLDKMRLLAKSPTALSYLHVCFRKFSAFNCGRCRKCSMTMIGFDLCGVSSQLRTFPEKGPDLRAFRRVLLNTDGMRRGVYRLRDLAVERGRSDVVRAIDRSLRRSVLMGIILRVLERMGRLRGLSGIAGRARRGLMLRVIR